MLSACGSGATNQTNSGDGTLSNPTSPANGEVSDSSSMNQPTANPTGAASLSPTTGTTDATGGDTAVPVPGATGQVTVADIEANADTYVGQQVTVVSTPREMLSSRVFRLSDSQPSDSSGGTSDELLVIGATDNMINDSLLNQPVQVTGVVTKLNISELETQLGITLDESLLSKYVDQPVLVATSVGAS
ncbi:MAG TPA: hypothetical protein VFT99_26395 [Roseiflexaceae bacterium]|nr:hypothetical protein [Roseiflexaceae bacterium]